MPIKKVKRHFTECMKTCVNRVSVRLIVGHIKNSYNSIIKGPPLQLLDAGAAVGVNGQCPDYRARDSCRLLQLIHSESEQAIWELTVVSFEHGFGYLTSFLLHYLVNWDCIYVSKTYVITFWLWMTILEKDQKCMLFIYCNNSNIK